MFISHTLKSQTPQPVDSVGFPQKFAYHHTLALSHSGKAVHKDESVQVLAVVK